MKKFIIATIMAAVTVLSIAAPSEANRTAFVTAKAYQDIDCNRNPITIVRAVKNEGYTTTKTTKGSVVTIVFKSNARFIKFTNNVGGNVTYVSTDRNTVIMKIRKISPRCLAR